MIQIRELSKEKVKEMKEVLGDHILKYSSPYNEENVDVILCDFAEIKFYNFDESVTIQLGAKKYLLENKDYWRIDLS